VNVWRALAIATLMCSFRGLGVGLDINLMPKNTSTPEPTPFEAACQHLVDAFEEARKLHPGLTGMTVNMSRREAPENGARPVEIEFTFFEGSEGADDEARSR